MAKGTEEKVRKLQPHRILRDTYRHYYEFEALVTSTGEHVIEHVIEVENGNGGTQLVPVSISFYDLAEGLLPQSEGGLLSERKRQAVMLNVIRDMKQKDVAAIMGITTVSVGQYVDHAMEQLARIYFEELYELLAKIEAAKAHAK